MAINCPYCGRETLPGAKFCSSCGSTLGQGAQPAQQSTPVWQGNTYTVVQPAGTNSNSRKKPGQTILAVALSAVLVLETCVAGFKYPGFFKTKKGGDTDDTGSKVVPAADVKPQSASLTMLPIKADQELLDYFGITQEQLDEFYDDPIEITAENSPGNPGLIDVSFTQEEIDSAETASAEVTVSNPVAKFPQFDMTVDMKWWNLENPTDTLTVKRLPVKKDENTGATLYTYDFSLASGQKEFPTEVEVTAPVQGDVNDMEGLIHNNCDGSGWEEDYYTLSEDGKYYTVCMTHFSWNSQWESNYKVNSLSKEGNAANRLYGDNDGTSLFKILPYQNVSKYNSNVNTWLYGVGLTKMPEFDSFLSLEDKATFEAIKKIIDEKGGISPEDGDAAFAGTMGTLGDIVSFADLLKSGPVPTSFPVLGFLATNVGWKVLRMRVADQIKRGVSKEKIISSNMSSLEGVALGVVGTGAGYVAVSASSAVASGVAAVCAVAGGILFVKTSIYDPLAGWAESIEKEKHPLGFGKDLEENAFFYYVSEYDDGSGSAPQRILKTITETIPITDGQYSTEGEKTQLNIRGTGWAQALDYIKSHYYSDPEKMIKATFMLYTEFEKYIDNFWNGLNGQEGEDMSKVREDCWRKFCCDTFLGNSDFNSQRLKKFTTGYWFNFVSRDLNDADTLFYISLKQKYGGISDAEMQRWMSLIFAAEEVAEKYSSSTDIIWKNSNNSTYVFTGNTSLTKDNTILFNNISKEKMEELKKYAKDVLYQNTNDIINAYYKRQRDEAIESLRMNLYQNVLPLFNTHVTFYLQDSSVKSSDITQSEDMTYDTFEFYNTIGKQFDPANAGEGVHTDGYPLSLKRVKGCPILLETNLYHYIRYGCPTIVYIKDSKGRSAMVTGETDWNNVRIMADPNSQYNSVPEEKQDEYTRDMASHYYFKDPSVYLTNIKDLKVPIVYTGRALSASKSSTLYLTSYDNTTLYDNTPSVTISVAADGTVTITVPSFNWTEEAILSYDIEKYYSAEGFTVTGKLVQSYGDDLVNSDGSSSKVALITSAPTSVSVIEKSEYTTKDFVAGEGFVDKRYVTESTSKLHAISLPQKNAGYNDSHIKIKYDRAGNIIGGSVLLNGKENVKSSTNGSQTTDNTWDDQWTFVFGNEKPVN